MKNEYDKMKKKDAKSKKNNNSHKFNEKNDVTC